MSCAVLWLCVNLFLVIFPHVNTKNINFMPGQREIIHENGLKHEISRYYVIPKDYRRPNSKPMTAESDRETIIDKEIDIKDLTSDGEEVKRDVVGRKTINKTFNNKGNQHINDGGTQYFLNNNQGINYNTGVVYRYLWEDDRKTGLNNPDKSVYGNNENKNKYNIADDDENKHPNHESSQGDNEDEMYSNIKASENPNYVYVPEYKVNEFIKSLRKIKQSSTTVSPEDELTKVIPLNDGNNKHLSRNVEDHENEFIQHWNPREKETVKPPKNYHNLMPPTTETLVQRKRIKVEITEQDKIDHFLAQQNLDKDINIPITEEKYEDHIQRNVEGDTTDPFFVIKELVERVKELKPIRYEDLHKEITEHNSVERESTGNNGSVIENSTEVEKFHNPSHIVELISKICDTANQNVKDFWTILAKYLGLHDGNAEPDLRKIEKLYEILTIFTQLRIYSDLGVPIDHIIDSVLNVIQSSNFGFDSNYIRKLTYPDHAVDIKKHKCQHCVNNVDDKILNLIKTHVDLKPDNLTLKQVNMSIEEKHTPADVITKTSSEPDSGENNMTDESNIFISGISTSATTSDDSLATEAPIYLTTSDYIHSVSTENPVTENYFVTTTDYDTSVVTTDDDSGFVTETLEGNAELFQQTNVTVDTESKPTDNGLPFYEESNKSQHQQANNNEAFIQFLKHFISNHPDGHPQNEFAIAKQSTETPDSTLDFSSVTEATTGIEHSLIPEYQKDTVTPVPIESISIVSKDSTVTNEYYTISDDSQPISNISIPKRTENDKINSKPFTIIYETSSESVDITETPDSSALEFSTMFDNNTVSDAYQTKSTINPEEHLTNKYDVEHSPILNNTYIDSVTESDSFKNYEDMIINNLINEKQTDPIHKSTNDKSSDFKINHTGEAVNISLNKYKTMKDYLRYIIDALRLNNVTESVPLGISTLGPKDEDSKHLEYKVTTPYYITYSTRNIKKQPDESIQDINNIREVVKHSSDKTTPRIEIMTSTNYQYEPIKTTLSSVETVTLPAEVEHQTIGELIPDHDIKEELSENGDNEVNSSVDNATPRTEESYGNEVTTPFYLPYVVIKKVPSVTSTTPVTDESKYYYDLINQISDILKKKRIEDAERNSKSQEESGNEMTSPKHFPTYMLIKKIPTVVETLIYPVNKSRDAHHQTTIIFPTNIKKYPRDETLIYEVEDKLESSEPIRDKLQEISDTENEVSKDGEKNPYDKIVFVQKEKHPKSLFHKIVVEHEAHPEYSIQFEEPESSDITKQNSEYAPIAIVTAESSSEPAKIIIDKIEKYQLPNINVEIAEDKMKIPKDIKVSDKGSNIRTTELRDRLPHKSAYSKELFPWLTISKDNYYEPVIRVDYQNDETLDEPFNLYESDQSTNKFNLQDINKIIESLKDIKKKPQYDTYENRVPNYLKSDLGVKDYPKNQNDILNLLNYIEQNPHAWNPYVEQYEYPESIYHSNIITDKIPAVPHHVKHSGAVRYLDPNVKKYDYLLTPKQPRYYPDRYVKAEPIRMVKSKEAYNDPFFSLLLSQNDAVVKAFVKTPTGLIKILKELNDHNGKIELFKPDDQNALILRVRILFAKILERLVPYLREHQVSDNDILEIISQFEILLLPKLNKEFANKCEADTYIKLLEKVEKLVEFLVDGTEAA